MRISDWSSDVCSSDLERTRSGLAVDALEIALQACPCAVQLCCLMAQKLVVIEHGAQKGRELALERGYVQPGEEIPDQRRATIVRRRARTREGDARIQSQIGRASGREGGGQDGENWVMAGP